MIRKQSVLMWIVLTVALALVLFLWQCGQPSVDYYDAIGATKGVQVGFAAIAISTNE